MARIEDEPRQLDEELYIEPSSIFISDEWEIIDDDFLELDSGEDIPLGPWEDELD